MKILIVRVGRTGDMVMVTPALSALLKKYIDAKFTFLTSTEGKTVLGDFDDRIECFEVYHRDALFSFMNRRAIKEKIKTGSFDHIYCFENNPSYYRLFTESNANVYGLRDIEGGKHYSQSLLDVVSAGVGSDVGFYPLSLPVRNDAIDKNDACLEGLGIHAQTLLVAIHPTFNGIGKRFRPVKHKKNKLWPPEYFGELSYRLRKYAEERHIDLKIVMNLMPEESEIGKTISACSRGSVVVFSPEPDFQLYKAFLKRANLLVTPDTGPMHIASALGTSVVALFSGKDPNDCGPFVPEGQCRILRAEETKIPDTGISAITVEDVYTACIKMIR